MVVAHCLYWKWKETVEERRLPWCVQGRVDAGCPPGCASGAGAQELLLGRGTREAVCVQVLVHRVHRVAQRGHTRRGEGAECSSAVSAASAICGNNW